jgi:hypothetical protein
MVVGALSQLGALPVPILAICAGVSLFLYRERVNKHMREMGGGRGADGLGAGCLRAFGIYGVSLLFTIFGVVFTVLVLIQALK